MFNNYYDTVSYEEKDNKDKFGNEVYKKPIIIKCRCVNGGELYVINKEDSALKYTKEYQIPNPIKEGDKLDGRLIVNVEPSKDVFGNIQFYIAKVI